MKMRVVTVMVMVMVVCHDGGCGDGGDDGNSQGHQSDNASCFLAISRSYGVTASTLDSESSDRGSNPRRTFFSGALGAWFSAASGESEILATLGPHSLVSLLLFWGPGRLAS